MSHKATYEVVQNKPKASRFDLRSVLFSVSMPAADILQNQIRQLKPVPFFCLVRTDIIKHTINGLT